MPTPPERSSASRLATRSWVPPAAVGAVMVVLPIVVTDSYHRSLLVRFCISLLLLTGLNMITGYGRMLSLAQAGFFGLGAYTAGVSVVKMGLPTEAGLVLAPLVVAVVAWLIGVPTLRLRGMYFVMATLGAGVVLFLAFGRAVSVTGGPNGLLGIPALSIAGFEFNTPLRMYMLAASLAFLGILGVHNLLRSRTGSALIALGVSEPGAAVVGVDAFGLRMVAFVLSGAYAGVAGALLTFGDQFVSPSTFDFLHAVVLVVILTVMGAGSFMGPILGAALLIGLDELLADYADYQPLILGLVFLVAIQVFPRGLAGFVSDRIRQRRIPGDLPPDSKRSSDGGFATSSADATGGP